MPTEELSPAPFDVDLVLSPVWLTDALQEALPGVVVSGTEVVQVIETTARKVRFTVTYDDTAGLDVPTALCIKGYFNPDFAQFGVTGVHEVRFYDRLASQVPIRVPHAWYSGIDAPARHGVVLMDDVVAQGATFFDQLSTYDVATTRRSLDELARLHAQYWDSPLVDEEFLAPKIRTFPGYVPDDVLNVLLAGPRGTGFPPSMRDAARLKAAMFALADRYRTRPRTLIHADAHFGNLYRTRDDRIGFVDWQNYECGHWSMDIAYHLATALDPAVRAESEHDLLAHYLQRLAGHGGPEIPPAQGWDDYRAGVLYGYYLWAITRRVEERITVELTQRLGRAVLAHDSLEVLGV